ncbi:MAG: diguanylate cyclase [Methylobacter sp.]|nr:diguanylate cyclase [Candidatus Methylobacter titanis]
MFYSRAETLLYHLANRYLRPFLPSEYLVELQDRFMEAEQQIKSHPEALAWSQRVLWLSHWDGVLSSNSESVDIAAKLSTALLHNHQVTIHYQGKDKPFQFNPFGLIKRDQSLMVVGSYWQNSDPFVLALRKILAIELTDQPAIQPAEDFDLQAFLNRQLNFPHSQEKIPCLQIEFSEDMYSYISDHALEAEHVHIISPAEYHHDGYFLLEAREVVDGERLRQWIRGFSHKAQVLKPNALRLVMEQARLDTRTNLLTATEFKRCLKREIQRCLRDKQMSFAMLILDLDHFKQVNDLNGHDFGDIVLLQVADCIREYDEAARHGGEEFCVLLPNTKLPEAVIIANRIRRQIEQKTLKNQHDKVVPVTASIGLAVFPNDLPANLTAMIEQGKDVAKLSELAAASVFHQADQALYQAKEQGRNRVCLAADLV